MEGEIFKKDFDVWNKLKKNLHNNSRVEYFDKKEVLY